MSVKYWGEIPKEPTNSFITPNVTADIERSMDKFCLAEYKDDSDMLKTEELVLPPMDPLVLYSISLHKYANDMTEMIRVAELATETNLIPPKDAAPPMPVRPEIDIRHKRNNLNYMPKDCTPFTCGWDVEIPELSEIVVKKLLSKSVATLFAHVGFETTHQSVMDVLTDVLESFFQKFCHKFVEVVDDEEKGKNTGFPHVIEKVLVETGMGGVKGLDDYYSNRVVKYVSVLQKRCEELNDHYVLLLIPKSNSPIDKFSKIVRVKVEEDKDIMEIHNSEVHFASLEGEPSLLETGYQLLNSLEAEENLQSLDATEEDMATAALGAVSIPSETEMCSLSPFAKKKRFK
ncbi:uncharacterized protein LOC108914455 [Anoplophora glabripennis]|uniref:uncharacterized protein LOC108914455 n=1 Tax=Anoplophora glabripennis TaxID=217634 RepID=UPI000875A11B|nr:uncharacterized protein LOC108914455 [Anoplophora glabripennis]